MRQRRFIIFAFAVGFLGSHCAARNIGDFTPQALSADESTIVGNGVETIGTPGNRPGEQGLIWTSATGVDYLPTAAQTPSLPQGVSSDGSIIVGYDQTQQAGGPAFLFSAWEWTAVGGYQSLTVPGYIGAKATSISDDGTTVGINAQQSGELPSYRGYTWTAADGFFAIPATPSGKIPRTAIVSADGKTVIGNTGEGGYIWTSATGSQDIPQLTGTFLIQSPQVMTPNGSMVFGATGSGTGDGLVFEYQNGVTTSLGQPLADDTDRAITLGGVTADGQILVGTMGAGNSGDSPFPFVWTSQGGFVGVGNYLAKYGINPVDAEITSVDGISQDGNILFGTAESTVNDGTGDGIIAWIAYLPEPTTPLLLLPIATTMLRRRN